MFWGGKPNMRAISPALATRFAMKKLFKRLMSGPVPEEISTQITGTEGLLSSFGDDDPQHKQLSAMLVGLKSKAADAKFDESVVAEISVKVAEKSATVVAGFTAASTAANEAYNKALEVAREARDATLAAAKDGLFGQVLEACELEETDLPEVPNGKTIAVNADLNLAYVGGEWSLIQGNVKKGRGRRKASRSNRGMTARQLEMSGLHDSGYSLREIAEHCYGNTNSSGVENTLTAAWKNGWTPIHSFNPAQRFM